MVQHRATAPRLCRPGDLPRAGGDVVEWLVPGLDAQPGKIAALTGGQVTGGSSLFCNATPGVPYNTLRDGADVTSWQFADDVHPTKKGHQLLSDEAVKALQSFGWL